jgi:HlyD family secretion protein
MSSVFENDSRFCTAHDASERRNTNRKNRKIFGQTQLLRAVNSLLSIVGFIQKGQSSLKKAIIGILVVGVAGAAVTFGVSRSRQQAAAKVEIGRTVTVKRGDVRLSVAETGTLEPVSQVEVKSRVAGRVLRIFVKEGQRVQTGDPIALIDPTEVQRDVARIEAQLAASRAGLAQAEENYRLTKQQNRLSILRAEAALTESKRRYAQAAAPNRTQDIAQAAAAVQRAEAALLRNANSQQRIEAQIMDAERNFERQKALVAKGFVAQSAQDTAQTSLQLAQADLAAAKNDRASAEAEVRSAKERLSLLKEGRKSRWRRRRRMPHRPKCVYETWNERGRKWRRFKISWRRSKSS